MASDKRRESMARATAGHDEPRHPMLLVLHGQAHMVGEAGDRRVALNDVANQMRAYR